MVCHVLATRLHVLFQYDGYGHIHKHICPIFKNPPWENPPRTRLRHVQIHTLLCISSSKSSLHTLNCTCTYFPNIGSCLSSFENASAYQSHSSLPALPCKATVYNIMPASDQPTRPTNQASDQSTLQISSQKFMLNLAS